VKAALIALGLALPATLALAQAPDRSKPPVPGPPRSLEVPAAERLSLSNGMPVLLVQAHEVPVVHVRVVIRAGGTADPLDRTGLAAMTAAMLDEGAGGRDALALADALDFLGAQLGTYAGWDSSGADLHVPVARLEPALGLLADVVERPDFPAAELERLRREALTQLLQSRDAPGAIAGRALSQAVFGRHRYGLPFGGDAVSLSAFTTDGLRAFYTQYYRPNNAVLIVVGDVTPAILPILEQAFGGWARGGAPAPALSAPAPVKGRSVVLVDRPGSAQSALRFGRVGPSRATPDYAALEVMNTLLGGSFTSRLNDNLREQHGYAYGAYSGFDYRRTAGLFVAAADVQTQSTAEALGEFMEELARIRTLAPPEDVERARNYLALSTGGDFETTRQLAARYTEQWLFGLPEDTFTAFVPKALAVGGPELRQAALSQVDVQNLAIVVVGDLKVVEAKVRALNLGPVRKLALDDVMGPAPRLPE
jgi:zinc protease